MILTYEKITGMEYFNYEIGWDEESKALAFILKENYLNDLELSNEQEKILLKGLVDMVNEFTPQEIKSMEDDFNDLLHEYFEKEAFDNLE